MMRMSLIKKLDGIYDFMGRVYQGNWKPRWIGTPFMSEFNDSGKSESILGHMWAMKEFWFQIKNICPELNKVVKNEVLYEKIMNHDLGETSDDGDISMTRQLNGEGSNKKLSEREQLLSLTKALNERTRSTILKDFDEFEEAPENIRNLETLIAKFIDTLQGDQFALMFGNNLPENSDLIDRIIRVRFVSYTQRLIDVLNELGYKKASKEIIQIANHHLEQIRSVGINITARNFV